MSTQHIFTSADYRPPNTTMQRFDARYWVINYPYSATATIVSETVSEFKVTCCFRSNRDLIGVLWKSADPKGHALLKYVNDRNYAGTVLAFVANPLLPYNFSVTITTQDGTFVYRLFPYKNVSGTLTCDYTDPVTQGTGTGKSYSVATLFPSGLTIPSGYQVYIIDFNDLRRGFAYNEGAISNGGVTELFLSIVPLQFGLGSSAYFASTSGASVSSVTMNSVSTTLKVTVGDEITVGSTVVKVTSVSGFGTTSRTLGITPNVALSVNTPVYTKGLINDSPLGNVDYTFYLKNMSVTGSRTTIGKYHYPQTAHSLQMTTGFDDSYDCTPWRQVDQIYNLGYRGRLVMYMGASHYYKSTATLNGSNQFVQTCNVGETNPINPPTVEFCKSLFSNLHTKGLQFVWSTSLEILLDHMPDNWNQRDVSGNLAQSGWVPHTGFMRPTSTEAKTHVVNTIVQGLGLMQTAGLDLNFQLGEFWWWDGSYTNGQPCIYDADTLAAYHTATGLYAPNTITNIFQQPLTSDEHAYCVWLGNTLGQFSVDVQTAVKAAYSGTPKSTLLFFTPQIFANTSVITPLLNFPITYWQYSTGHWDFMQIEDYDWIIAGDFANLPKTREAAVSILGYPLANVDYFIGFVLNAVDQFIWDNASVAFTASVDAGLTNNFVWAYTQVIRDNIVYVTKDPIVLFREEVFPESYSYFLIDAPAFKSYLVELPESGRESRSLVRSCSRSRFVLQARDIREPVKIRTHYNMLRNFFLAVAQGDVYAFRLKNPNDYNVTAQVLGTGDGANKVFQCVKDYTFGAYTYRRTVYKLIAGTLLLYVNTGSGAVLQTSGYTVDINTGKITFTTAPITGAIVSATFEFHYPVRFSAKEFPFTVDTEYGIRGLDSLEMLEVIL